jgi:hypothetical protein
MAGTSPAMTLDGSRHDLKLLSLLGLERFASIRDQRHCALESLRSQQRVGKIEQQRGTYEAGEEIIEDHHIPSELVAGHRIADG